MSNIAYCGLNCEACSFRVAALTRDAAHLDSLPDRYAKAKRTPIAELELCPGCKAEGCSDSCPMQKCAAERGFSTCAECAEMPCEKLIAFSSDGVPHHACVIKNLNRIRKAGEEAFALEQQALWTCSCGARRSWYLSECAACGKKR